MWVKVLALFIGVCCANITPFSINVGEDVLDDLKTRLENTRLPDQVEGAGWDYGANLEYMKVSVYLKATTQLTVANYRSDQTNQHLILIC